MYIETICYDGKTKERKISDYDFGQKMLQLYFLREGGEDILIWTNASEENGWKRTKIFTVRMVDGKEVIKNFSWMKG